MEKFLCIESQSYYSIMPFNTSPKQVSIVKNNLYYIKFTNIIVDKTYYNVYDFNTAEYIGVFSSEYFGPYNLWIALQRDLKIEEILND